MHAPTRADRVLLVGGGKMGGALAAGWLDGGVVAAGDLAVVEPDSARAEALRRRLRLRAFASPEAAGADLDAATVVFAVKPQVIDRVVPVYRALAQSDRLFLSIAAGMPIGFFERRLGEAAAVVRAMPNTPAAIGRGMTVLCANPKVSDDQRGRATALMEAVGAVAWIEDESLMDAVTAVSGSGPAYVFLLIECLTEAGIAAGLPGDLAAQLAAATVSGAGELAARAEDTAAVLRANVTSPGGTTAAALEVLMAGDGLEALMTRAVAAATARSRELAKS